MALASDLNNREFLGATNPDAALHVEFYADKIQNFFKTELEGRPIFEDVTMIKIQVPGDKTFNATHIVREEHKARFPIQWAHYQNTHGNDPMQIGTPLSQWPIMTPAIIEELKYQKYHTVEQIANASDAQINAIGLSGGLAPFTLRERAKRFLEIASDDSVNNAREEKIKQQDKLIADMQAQLAALTAGKAETKDSTLHIKKG